MSICNTVTELCKLPTYDCSAQLTIEDESDSWYSLPGSLVDHGPICLWVGLTELGNICFDDRYCQID